MMLGADAGQADEPQHDDFPATQVVEDVSDHEAVNETPNTTTITAEDVAAMMAPKVPEAPVANEMVVPEVSEGNNSEVPQAKESCEE